MSIPRWNNALRQGSALALLSLTLGACASAGPFGYSQLYTPLDAEDAAMEGSVPFDPSAARRKPEAWRGRRVAAFGVVVEVTKGDSDGTQRVQLSMRGLQPRNLCDGPDEESCRVTVTDTEFAKFWAVVPLGELVPERSPPDPIQPGSLLRVIGQLELGPNEAEPPTVRATFARHWPLKTYVTTGSRESMRR